MQLQELKQNVSAAIAKRDFALAERLCVQAASTVASVELLLVRGALYSAQGRLADAVSMLRQAHEAQPQRGDIAYNYGVVLQQSGDMASAVRAWECAVSAQPQNAAAWINLVLGTIKLGDEHAASEISQRALRHHPANRDLLYNHANVLYRLGELTQSEAQFNALLAAHANDALGWTNLGMVQKALGRFAEAEASIRRALALSNPASAPRAHYNLANLLLLQARWREGFAEYEWRLKLPGSIDCPWPLPRWTPGLPKGSRVLLWNDQGQGDAMMYLRYAPLLAKRGYEVFAFVQDSVKALAATSPSIRAAYSPADERQPMDAQLPLCSLPHALDLDSPDIWPGPYLHAPPDSATDLSHPSAKRLRVGLVWAGNRNHDNDANRSMRLGDLNPLLDVPDVEWFSLQVGGQGAELNASPHRERVLDLSPQLVNFSATAAALTKLDLLISVDTSPAHLAGALGRPVWTLLPATGSDWRWGTEGGTTFWYPSMRLFRQTQAGDWKTVVAKVAREIGMLRRVG
jgi:Tfp pilus assembly protein PilF